MFCSSWFFVAQKSISFTRAMTFSPLLYDPHVLQWDYSCKASSAHAEALRKTGVTLYWPISDLLSSPTLWSLGNIFPTTTSLPPLPISEPIMEGCSLKSKLSGFQCLRTRTPGVWAPTAVCVVWAEVQLASYSKAAASLLWSLMWEGGVHSAAFPVKESKRLHTIGLHLWVLHFPSYPLVLGGWHRAGWIYIHAMKNLFQHHSREKYFQSFSLCWISATIKVQNWGLIGI